MLALCSISPATQAWRADTLAPWVGTTLEGRPCRSGQVGFGPFDYRERDKETAALQVVEESHFSADTENLIDSGYEWAMNDIHYVLQTWPNHHRALNSALKYRLQLLWNWDAKTRIPPAECYLQRAIKFSPTDPKPYMMYGVLLQKTKQYDKALNAYRKANRLMPNDLITQYNMGLTLVELKKYTEAKQLAEKVYRAGFPLPALKKKLIAAGHWNEGAGDTVANPAKQEFTPAQMEAIKKAMQNPTPAQKDAIGKAMQDQAARKQAAPVAEAP
jgi:tetratricopeptide (TPR) repeat protein